MAYEQLSLIGEVTRNDGSKYYEISSIDQNGIAELTVDHGLIKRVRILQLDLVRTKVLRLYKEYIDKTYQLETLTNENDWRDPQRVEWERPRGKVLDAFNTVLKANHIGWKRVKYGKIMYCSYQRPIFSP